MQIYIFFQTPQQINCKNAKILRNGSLYRPYSRSSRREAVQRSQLNVTTYDPAANPRKSTIADCPEKGRDAPQPPHSLHPAPLPGSRSERRRLRPTHIPSNRGAPLGKRLEPSATAAQAETIMVREGVKIKRQRTGTPLAAARAIAARTAIQLPIPASAGGDEPQGGGQHNRYFFNTHYL